MHRELIHLYGPFAINSFGLMIIIGLLIFSLLILSDPKRTKILSSEQYFNLLAPAILVALVGGRLLYVIAHWHSIDSFLEIFAVWQGGFSLLGGVIALLLVMPYFFKKNHISLLPFLDLAAIYAPLLQGISRFGCFFAGCCFGSPTNSFLGIINPSCSIESYINKPLHPTQLYSAFALFLIFLSMYFVFQYRFKYPGQLACFYLILMSTERFIIDFWRGDREFLSTPGLNIISIPQLVAVLIAFAASAMLIYLTFFKKHIRI